MGRRLASLLAVLSIGAACGSESANQTPEADGGGATNAGGAGGNDPTCPLAPPKYLAAICKLAPGVSCHYEVDCQSGTQEFVYSCGPFGWKIDNRACDPAKPYDSCPHTGLSCYSQWTECASQCDPVDMECPYSAPAPGSECEIYGTGTTTYPNCGYPCGPAANPGWQVATCVMPDAGFGGVGTWQYETGCNTNGGGS
jgi:hypothetical protein